jgi:hypothetical protein
MKNEFSIRVLIASVTTTFLATSAAAAILVGAGVPQRLLGVDAMADAEATAIEAARAAGRPFCFAGAPRGSTPGMH